MNTYNLEVIIQEENFKNFYFVTYFYLIRNLTF